MPLPYKTPASSAVAGRVLTPRPQEVEFVNVGADADVLQAQREASGSLPDDDPGNPVRDQRPFKNLRSK